MERFRFLLYDPKKFFSAAVIAFYVLPLAIVGVLAATAAAMSGGGNPPGPYTGGAPVAKVMYPADGSTITVTTTGAVIKQSPGGTPYRQGCVNPASIGGYNSLSDMRGHITSCSNGPQPNKTSVTTGIPINNSGSSGGCANPYCQPTVTHTNGGCTNPMCQPTITHRNGCSNPYCQPTISHSNGCANAYCQPSKPQYLGPPVTNNNYQPPAQTTSYTNPPATTTSYKSPPSTTKYSAPSANYTKSLPDTGPGNMMAIGGLTTVFATIGHFLYARRRSA